MSTPSKSAVRYYVATILLLSFGYAGTVFLAVYALNSWAPSPWRYVVSLAPVFPLIAGWPAVARVFRAHDELQRKIAVEALGIAFGVTAIATSAYGWLQFAGLPPVNLTVVFPFVSFVFGITYALRTWRYSR